MERTKAIAFRHRWSCRRQGKLPILLVQMPDFGSTALTTRNFVGTFVSLSPSCSSTAANQRRCHAVGPAAPLNQNVMAAKIRPPPFMSGPAVHHGVAFGDRLAQLSVKPALLSIGDVGKHHPAVKSLGGWILTKAGGRRTATKSRLMQITLP